MKIEKILLFALSCLVTCSLVQAQQAFGGKPKSFTHRSLDRDGLRSLSPEVGQAASRLEVERRISASALRTEAMALQKSLSVRSLGGKIPTSAFLARKAGMVAWHTTGITSRTRGMISVWTST